MGPYVAQVLERRSLIWHLARSGLKADNYNTVLGQLWIIIDPLLMAGIYYLIRVVLRPVASGDERLDIIAHLIAGVFFFQFTSRALTQGSRSLVQNKGVILNSSFPRAVFPVVALVDGLLEFAPRLAVYFVLHAVFGQPFTVALLCLPVLFALQALFTFGLVLIFSPLTVRFRDTSKFLPYFVRIWLFTTPILWTASEIPSNLSWLKANPLFPFFAALEQIFDGDWPAPQYLLAAAAYAGISFVIGVVVFLKLERDVASHL